MKASTSSRTRPASGRRTPKRRVGKRAGTKRKTGARSVTGTIVRTAPGAIAQGTLIPDKREDELTDEESLDREERQELY